MAIEVVGKILSIVADQENAGYMIEFWVSPELTDRSSLPEAFAMLGNVDRLQRQSYAMHVVWEDDQFGMEPDERLLACLEVYDEHDSPNGLDAEKARQWKTGQIADAIVTQLIDSNVFGVWRTGTSSDDSD